MEVKYFLLMEFLINKTIEFDITILSLLEKGPLNQEDLYNLNLLTGKVQLLTEISMFMNSNDEEGDKYIS